MRLNAAKDVTAPLLCPVDCDSQHRPTSRTPGQFVADDELSVFPGIPTEPRFEHFGGLRDRKVNLVRESSRDMSQQETDGGTRNRWRQLLFLLGVAVSLLLNNTRVFAQDASEQFNKPPVLSGEGGAIPVRIIDGRIVVSCDISGSKLRAPTNLWLDFDGPYGLQLHNRSAAGLPAETQSGKPLPLTLHFADFTLEVARRELGPEEEFEEFTKYHSKEIGENALSGAIGAEILKHFDVIFDLPRGEISLRPPGGLAGRTEGATPREVLVQASLQNDLIWLPVRMQGPQGELKRALAIGSSRYDTVLDRRLCGQLRRPAGNVGAVECSTIDFAPFVAFRPEEVVQVHRDGVAGVMGINLLKCFRVHVDRESLLVTLQKAGSPKFPTEELEWFQAKVTEDSFLVQDWLEKHSETRLGREAAEFLLNILLDEGAETEELVKAVTWVNDTMPKDLRATRMFDLLEELVNEGSTDIGIRAGQLGLKSAREDRYPESNYKLHGRIGELLLPTDNRQAWRHLLSAAFGLPEDGMINLNLGRCYEANGQRRRAFSRYVQALIKEESSAQAMEALTRLDQEVPQEERMTIEMIDRMISGRVYNFTAPDTFEPEDPALRSSRTSVVEFFTNSYVGNERAGAIGGALCFQGLESHFEPRDCVFLSYHLPVPKIDPLISPLGEHMARWLEVRSPAVQVIDGQLRAPGAGRRRSGESIYKVVRSAVAKQLNSPTDVTVDAMAEVNDERVSGQVTIASSALDLVEKNATNPMVVQIVVAERGVVFHGSSAVVIHRMLARGLATEGPLDGVPFVPDDNGQITIDFDRKLSELIEMNTEYLDRVEEGTTGGTPRMGLRIEPRSVEVIVLVRDVFTAKVHQAHQIELKRPEAWK